MSNLPPPTFGPPSSPASPPPPPPHVPFARDVAPPPPPPARSNRGKIIAAIVVVVLLIAGGAVFLATRDDDNSDAKPAETTSVETDATEGTDAPGTSVPETEATQAPDTTAVDTTDVDTTDVETTAVDTTDVETTDVETTDVSTDVDNTDVETTDVETTDVGTTIAPTSTTAFVAPQGSIDLGHQVFLPIPSGWSQVSDPGDPVVISDGTTKFGVQALARDRGEDIAALVQEYTDTFDSEFAAVAFGPTRFLGPLNSPVPINEYLTRYTTFDTGAATGLSGGIDTVVRADGLSVVIDLFSPGGVPNLPEDAYNTLLQSLVAAPRLGPSAKLTEHPPFTVTSVTPFAAVDGLTGFSIAPGYSIVTPSAAGSPFALASTGAEDFSAQKVGGQTDVNSVIAAAQQNLQLGYGNLAYNAPTADPADQYGLLHGQFTWSGTYLDGQPSSGTIDYYFDPATGNAYITYRSWYTTSGPNEPSAAEAAFMERSFVNTFDKIP